ncbi:MAG: cache domain-containing protein [Pseudomonadota bacterium]
MKKSLLLSAAMAMIFSGSALAEDFATAKDAEALVTQAVKAIAADKDGTLKAITAKDPKWVHGDLYPFVYNLKGEVVAHGQNERMVGKNMIENTDADGKPMVKERLELAKTKGTFWQDYKWKNPVTKKVEQKSSYCETKGELIICAGIYKR